MDAGGGGSGAHSIHGVQVGRQSNGPEKRIAAGGDCTGGFVELQKKTKWLIGATMSNCMHFLTHLDKLLNHLWEFRGAEEDRSVLYVGTETPRVDPVVRNTLHDRYTRDFALLRRHGVEDRAFTYFLWDDGSV